MKSVEHDLLPTIIRNAFWSTCASVAAPVIAFLFGGLTIRYVGIEAAGFTTAIGAILAIVGQIGSLGLSEAIMPALAAGIGADDRPRVRRLIGLALCFALVSSCLTAVLLVACADPLISGMRMSPSRETAKEFMAITAVTAVITALSGGVTGILRSASRYDLVAKISMPLSLLKGTVGCLVVPLFPSLRTIALIGLVTALCDLPILFCMASRIVPETAHPSFTLSELPRLARYGAWTSLTKLVSLMSSGIDDLVITGTCGAAALPPWTICKRLWLTMHTFLAQHVEHLIPTLGGVGERSQQMFHTISAGMHWYVVVVAAAGYTLIGWAGPVIIAVVAGEKVAALCTVPLFAVSLTGVFWSLSIIPVISAMATSDARPGFIVALGSSSVQLAAVVMLVRTLGTPWVYLAPLAVIPVVLVTLGTSKSWRFEPGLAWRRVRPVLVPLVFGVTGVLSGVAAGTGPTHIERILLGTLLAAMVGGATLMTENVLGINAAVHRQCAKAVRYAIGSGDGIRRLIRVCWPRGAAEP